MSSQNPWPDEWFETVDTCPFCRSADLRPGVAEVEDFYFRAVPGGFEFRRCAGCLSLVLTRRPDEAHIVAAYADYYTHAEAAGVVPSGWKARLRQWAVDGYAAAHYGQKSGFKSVLGRAIVARRTAWRNAVDAAYRSLPANPARVLDYGCGGGEFLRLARSLGHQVVGVDFDPDAIEAAARDGILVLTPEAAEAEFSPSAFDHITLSHVIEHVADPGGLLATLRGWTSEGGAIFVDTPNALAAGLTRHGRFWRGLEAPRHFAVPSDRALLDALEQAGFAPRRIIARTTAATWMDSEARRVAEGADPWPGSRLDHASGQCTEPSEFLTIVAQAV